MFRKWARPGAYFNFFLPCRPGHFLFNCMVSGTDRLIFPHLLGKKWARSERARISFLAQPESSAGVRLRPPVHTHVRTHTYARAFARAYAPFHE